MPRRRDVACLVSTSELEQKHGVRNAVERVKGWLRDGLIHEAGRYFPPSGPMVPLYPENEH